MIPSGIVAVPWPESERDRRGFQKITSWGERAGEKTDCSAPTLIRKLVKSDLLCEKTCLRGFRPGTQTGLYNQGRWIEA